MMILIDGQRIDIEYIRVHRDARSIVFFALVDGQWVKFIKSRNKQLPTYDKLSWPNPEHKYGWSDPFMVKPL